MDPLPLSIQTLYADLLQQAETASRDEATVVTTEVNGVRYLRLQRWVGAKRVVEHLGRGDDPAVRARADRAGIEMQGRRERRKLVAALRRFVGGPSPKLGKVLHTLAYAGLFERGAVLVGTGAYQCYPALIGDRLAASALTTQDADIATADLALSGAVEGEDLATILRRADPGFSGIMGLDPRKPSSRFRSPDGFVVDCLTPMRRRSDTDPMPLPRLAAGATPLQHLDWLIDEPIRALALHGAGILVTVPQPVRYAIHKLIVAQKRPAGESGKRAKDLVQAHALKQVLQAQDSEEWDAALEDARSRGPGWAKPIDLSLRYKGIGPGGTAAIPVPT
ncbi:GSU2403 family nucleotidyltransferase fold protein [uncultured Enterovirga sp.]|uniref:GSU2403 family nucleotidyltransferase fold protein n=1 Tax=uncultured Enterovirga sp. TaxID=2026352 RepID=UPI0035CB6D78